MVCGTFCVWLITAADSQKLKLVSKLFLRVRVSCDKLLLAPTCVSVRLSACINADEFSWDWKWWTSTKICRETPDLAKIGGSYSTLYRKNWLRLYCWQQYEIFCSSTAVQTEHIVALAWQHNIFVLLTGTFLSEIQKERIVALWSQQWLRERATHLLNVVYLYISDFYY